MLNGDLENKSSEKRKKLSDSEAELATINEIENRLKSIHYLTWQKIENWGRETGKLTRHQIDVCANLRGKIKNNRVFTDLEREQGEVILDIVVQNSPELFFDMEDFFKNDNKTKEDEIEITLELVQKIVQWDMRNKRLGVNKYKFMVDLVEGKILLTDKNKYLAKLNLQAIEKYGFR